MSLPRCLFCEKLRLGSQRGPTNPWDEHIFSTPECVAMPTRGAMVPGWMLVSPRYHFLSIGAMDERLFAEFDALVEQVVTAVEDTFGPTVLFEHGPACGGHPIGCGVDHAHLHVVPTSFDLLSQVNTIFPGTLNWTKVCGLSATREAASQGLSYLYFHSAAVGSVIATHRAFESQLFRRALASCLGRPNRYDWRDDPGTSTVHLTVSTLGNWKLASGLFRSPTV